MKGSFFGYQDQPKEAKQTSLGEAMQVTPQGQR